MHHNDLAFKVTSHCFAQLSTEESGPCSVCVLCVFCVRLNILDMPTLLGVFIRRLDGGGAWQLLIDVRDDDVASSSTYHPDSTVANSAFFDCLVGDTVQVRVSLQCCGVGWGGGVLPNHASKSTSY